MGGPAGERQEIRPAHREAHRGSGEGNIHWTFQGGSDLENLGLFDTHCHLCDDAFRDDLEDVLVSANRSGVTDFIVPGIDLSTSRAAASLSEGSANIYAAAGMHPNQLDGDAIRDLASVPEILIRPGVVAVGETGLDFHYDRVSGELQRSCFLEHARMAEAFGMTLVVHSRDAEPEVLEVLEDGVTVPVVMHCYTGPSETALKAAERGYYIGFTGALTYRRNSELRELASQLPADRILIETDSPYLSPEPLRGRRNEPSHLVYVAETLCESLKMDLDRVSDLLRRNSRRAFQLEPFGRTDLVYRLYGNTYMNITGRCDNHCRFCIRDRTDGLGGYHLTHGSEPEARRLESLVEYLPAATCGELVFCGYGEPTMRPELLRKLAFRAGERGLRVRLNTNGTCLCRMSAEGTAAMLEPFDAVSVSINASCSGEYNSICRPESPNAWERLMEFIGLAMELTEVRLTAVRYPGIQTDRVKKLAEDFGLPFRVRG